MNETPQKSAPLTLSSPVLNRRIALRLSIVLGVILIVLFGIAMGPRPEIDETITFDPATIGDDLDQWLAAREAKVPDIRPGAEKEIVWADPATRAKTPLAVIYVHGFSATKWETRPLADKVAGALGANLFFTRLAGHGQNGEALGKTSLNDWVNDMAEAVAIAEKIGDRILIVGCSTGSTLGVWTASNERLINKVIGLAFLSPNFQWRGLSTGLLNMPWGKQFLPLFFGKTRSWKPFNEGQAKWWTTSYPSTAGLAMAALLRVVEDLDKRKITVPTMFVYSPNDQVVSPVATRLAYAEWGGPKTEFLVEKSGDPSNHVIAGDILSPGTTEELAGRIVEWANTLKR